MNRTERDTDRAAVHAINVAAFGQPGEANVVDALRADPAAFLPDFSLVAVEGQTVVGHLLISKARLVRAAATAYPLVSVLGHPAFYPRFGLVSARAHGIETPYEAPHDAWMIFLLPRHASAVRGQVIYPSAFAAL